MAVMRKSKWTGQGRAGQWSESLRRDRLPVRDGFLRRKGIWEQKMDMAAKQGRYGSEIAGYTIQKNAYWPKFSAFVLAFVDVYVNKCVSSA